MAKRRDLATTMSKRLALGVSLDDVVRAPTETPARPIRALDELGPLAPGAAADVTVIRLACRRHPSAVDPDDRLARSERAGSRVIDWLTTIGRWTCHRA